MTDKDHIKLFEINTDAVAVNRGFYYQYLTTLKKWILNYIHQTDNFIYCEVDDDIKEVGNKLIFTQVKCYSKNFSLRSDEIKKSLFHFFIQFLKHNKKTPIEFCFNTNTGIANNEKLLQAWFDNPELMDVELAKQVLKKIKEILNAEINKHKRKKLEKKNISRNDINVIKRAAEQLKIEVDNIKADTFPKCVKWVFLTFDPISAVDILFKEVRQLLSHKVFKSKPIPIIESVFLSEIFKCSQLPDENKRVLSNNRIDELINETDSNLNGYIDERLITLLGVKFEEIEQSFKNIQKNQASFEKRMDSFDERVSNINNNYTDFNYPKNLTLIPKSLNEGFYGRQKSLEYINKQLTETQCLCITGSGGAGKSFLIQNFVKQYQNQYDHIAWINSSPNLSKSVLLDTILLKNLKLELSNQTTDEVKIDIVCNELQRLNGNNLLIIDNYENDINTLKKIIFLNNWSFIITTRENIPETTNYKLPHLDTGSAAKIFSNYCIEVIDGKTLSEFLDYIDYNPLVVKLCAQTITNSVDLTLESLFNSIKEQNLDDENIEIEVNVLDEDYPITILSYLHKKFELKNLTTNEEFYLGFLALLPSEDIDITDIALIGGNESYKKNLKDFTNWTNSLQSKGWVEKSDGKIRMYRLVQELIIYNTRKQPDSFISNILLINWLFHRIDEVVQVDPTLSFRFLKYAESILKSIKEEFRDSIYQPLLLLENALLNSYIWIENSNSLHQRWIDLIRRAEAYLPKDDINLGIMYNNLGYSYARRGDIDSAVIYFEQSISILKKQEKKSINVLINSINNLTQAFLVLGNLQSANNRLKESDQLINKHSLQDSQFIAARNYCNAVYLMKSGKFNEAANQYDLAIKTHLRIDKKNRNDLLLLTYYSNLIYMLFKLEQGDDIIKNIEKVYEIIEKHKMNCNSIFKEVKIMIDNINEYYQTDANRKLPC